MKKIMLLVGAIAMMLSSCQDLQETIDIDEGYGKLIVNITDAPFPMNVVEDVEVTFFKGELFVDEDDNTTGIILFDEPVTIKLLNLQNGVTEQLAEVDLPSGYYSHLRLYVESASITIKDHGTYDMKVPSGNTSGLKVHVNPPVYVQNGLSAELLLDFDVSRSFVMQGNMNTPAGIKGFNFKPVIRAVNNTVAGRIQGYVYDNSDNVLEDASVWLEYESIVATSFSDETGYYAMIGVPANEYTLWAACEGYDTLKTGVSIYEGNITEKDLVLVPVESE